MQLQTHAPLRIDKWLWAARFYKTRSLARTAIEAGHVRVNDARVKPSRELRTGEHVRIERGGETFEIVVQKLDERRGPASVAAEMYTETPASLAERSAAAQMRALSRADAVPGPRPTKRDRRQIERLRSSSPT